MTIETILTPPSLPGITHRDFRQHDVRRVRHPPRHQHFCHSAAKRREGNHHRQRNSRGGRHPPRTAGRAARRGTQRREDPEGTRPAGRHLAGNRKKRRHLAGWPFDHSPFDFDFGNSPREFRPEKVRGKTIVSTTTNGTRALRACAGAKTILAASFLNLAATAKYLNESAPEEVLLVCAGTGECLALEDVLAAGALAGLIGGDYSDATEIACARFFPPRPICPPPLPPAKRPPPAGHPRISVPTWRFVPSATFSKSSPP